MAKKLTSVLTGFWNISVPTKSVKFFGIIWATIQFLIGRKRSVVIVRAGNFDKCDLILLITQIPNFTSTTWLFLKKYFLIRTKYTITTNYEIRGYYERAHIERKPVQTRAVASCITPISTITPTCVRTIIVHTRGALWTVVAEVFAFIVICSEKKKVLIYFYILETKKSYHFVVLKVVTRVTKKRPCWTSPFVIGSCSVCKFRRTFVNWVQSNHCFQLIIPSEGFD